jgi:hypothetical protein
MCVSAGSTSLKLNTISLLMLWVGHCIRQAAHRRCIRAWRRRCLRKAWPRLEAPGRSSQSSCVFHNKLIPCACLVHVKTEGDLRTKRAIEDGAPIRVHRIWDDAWHRGRAAGGSGSVTHDELWDCGLSTYLEGAAHDEELVITDGDIDEVERT